MRRLRFKARVLRWLGVRSPSEVMFPEMFKRDAGVSSGLDGSSVMRRRLRDWLRRRLNITSGLGVISQGGKVPTHWRWADPQTGYVSPMRYHTKGDAWLAIPPEYADTAVIMPSYEVDHYTETEMGR